MAVLDLDDFKLINDTYGHQAGDDALRILVSAVTACVRNRNDALVRYGGDEFLLIFPHIPEHVFIKRLEQIRATVQALHMIEYPDLHLTVSIGGVYGVCPLDPRHPSGGQAAVSGQGVPEQMYHRSIFRRRSRKTKAKSGIR